VDVFRTGVPGGAKLSMILTVVGDEGASSGGGEDVREVSAAAAMTGAMAVSVFTLPLPNDTRLGCSRGACPFGHDIRFFLTLNGAGMES
jgi:hypothetical protein